MAVSSLPAETSRRITIARAILLAGVVYDHAQKGIIFHGQATPVVSVVMDLLDNYIIRPTVPLFYTISAYLLFLRYGGIAGYPRLVVKRFRGLLLPSILLNLFWAGYILLIGSIPGIGGPTWVKSQGIATLLFGGLNGLPLIYPLWFLRTLFWCVLLTPVFAFLLRRAAWLTLAVLWLCYGFIPPGATSVDTMAPFFFYIGGFLAVKRVDVDGFTRFLWPATALWGLFIAGDILVKTLLSATNYWHVVLWYNSTVFGIAAVWMFFCKARLGADNRASRLLLAFAPFAFLVYLLHEPAISFLTAATGWMLGPGSISQMAYTVFLAAATIALTMLVAWLLKRFVPPVHRVLNGGR